MELQCCGEFEAGSRKSRSKKLTIQKYLDFCELHKHSDELHKHSDLTVDQLNKIINIHGFKRLQNVRKEVLIDVVDSIELMDLTRSTITDDNVSSYAFITSEEAIKDLMCLNWIECSLTSFKTFNFVNYSLQTANDVVLKSKAVKKKPPNMSRLKDVAEPACSLASGDQCSAKGNTDDCEAADPLSLSSLLTAEKEPQKMCRLKDVAEPACSLASGDQCSAKGNTGVRAAVNPLSTPPLSTTKKTSERRRLENIVKPACSFASGDQCSAKGNTSDSAASDDLTFSSFLTTKKKPPKMRRLENRVKPDCSLAPGDQYSAKGNIGSSAASDHLSLSCFLPEAGEQVLQALNQLRPIQKRHATPGILEGRISEFQNKEKQQSAK